MSETVAWVMANWQTIAILVVGGSRLLLKAARMVANFTTGEWDNQVLDKMEGWGGAVVTLLKFFGLVEGEKNATPGK